MVVSVFRPQSVAFARTNVSDLFRPALQVASSPFYRISLFLHDVTNIAQLQADNARLEEENIKLREWYQTALLLESENKSLRNLLNLKLEDDYDHVGARVIGDSGNTYVNSVLTMVGRDVNVHKNAVVLSGNGLIGRVIEVGAKTSRVLLVTDVNSRVPVVVQDTGQHAVMVGSNDFVPRLIHLPQDSEITEGTRLMTSGYGGVYPRGIPVGKVVLLENGQPGVRLFSDLDRLQIVRIVLTDTPKGGEQ